MNSINNQPSFGAIVRVQGFKSALIQIKESLPGSECLIASEGYSGKEGNIHDVYMATGDDAEKLTEFKEQNSIRTRNLESLNLGVQTAFDKMFKNVVNCGINLKNAVTELTSQE